MKNQPHPTEASSTIAPFALPRALRMETVEPLITQLQTLFESDAEIVTLDAAAIEQTGTAGIQLLLSFEKTLRANGRNLALVNAPQPFADSWEMLGLTESLQALVAPQLHRTGEHHE